MEKNKDQMLLKVFMEEASELIDSISNNLRTWRDAVPQKTNIEDLKRDLHTLKGSARMVGQMELGTVAHEMETLVEGLLKGQAILDKSAIEKINLGLDQISFRIESLKKPEPPVAQEEIAQEAKEVRPTQEMIRIDASLLEVLNNLRTETMQVRQGMEKEVEQIKERIKSSREEVEHLTTELTNLQVERKEPLDKVNKLLAKLNLSLRKIYESSDIMEGLLFNQARIHSRMQHRLSDARLIPFESIVPRLSRMARQVSSELKKPVDFNVMRSEGEVDRTLLDHLIPSLEHLLRNAIDHGIETKEDRLRVGKPETGTIEVKFAREGSIASIELSDDGAGIDIDQIRTKAIKLGLLTPEQKITDEEAIRFILEPGFSTRETVSLLSGRGVGMDVVATAVKEIGGTLNILSTQHKGTRMIIRFPFTSSLNRVLLFEVQDKVLGMLLSDIQGIVRLTKKELEERLSNPYPLLEQMNHTYHMMYLGKLIDPELMEFHLKENKTFPVLLLSSPDFPVALIVDEVKSSTELFIQSLGSQFKLILGYSGAAILPQGKVTYILDKEDLIKKANQLQDQSLSIIDKNQLEEFAILEPTLLVVDDSASARSMAKSLLEKQHYHVITAKDGVEALKEVEEQKPALILLDIDMPRMNGFELATRLRGDERYKDIPIVILSAVMNSEREQWIKELKLEGFIPKPYEEAQLLLKVQSITGNIH